MDEVFIDNLLYYYVHVTPFLDRGSASGTMVNTQKIGGEDRGGTCELKDGDIIKIGAKDSLYLFQFITLS